MMNGVKTADESPSGAPQFSQGRSSPPMSPSFLHAENARSPHDGQVIMAASALAPNDAEPDYTLGVDTSRLVLSQ